MTGALLSVRDLSVDFSTYGQTNHVLHGVSLDVPEGSQVALVGVESVPGTDAGNP